uniref:Carboxypeptidase Q n=1 Tax=Sinocyclocheilus grahami TaxID=75366 RepID=A0A672PS82_SINGR
MAWLVQSTEIRKCLRGKSQVSLSAHGTHSAPHSYDSKPLSEISKEVSKYSDIANQIIKLAVYGKAQNRSDERLAEFTDTIGNRNALTRDGLENVHLELVKIPHWVRGEESVVMLLPRNHTLAILGLGSSVGTPPGGIEAEVMVVESFEELKKRASEAKGKIVVCDQPFVSYGETVAYRASGASEAAKVGSVASLIRSVTPFSINSPHTGWQWYQPGVAQIPTACITVEDAQMMARMACRGQRIVVRLTMGAQTLPDVDSYNTVAEITGSEHPELVVSTDASNMGWGALCDGKPAFSLWLKEEGRLHINWLHPKRTLRTVLWSAEEPGRVGAAQYFQQHKVHFLIILTLLCSTHLAVASTLQKDNFHTYESHHFSSVHYVFFPGASLHTANHFWFHHSDGDTMSVQNPEEMNLCGLCGH